MAPELYTQYFLGIRHGEATNCHTGPGVCCDHIHVLVNHMVSCPWFTPSAHRLHLHVVYNYVAAEGLNLGHEMIRSCTYMIVQDISESCN